MLRSAALEQSRRYGVSCSGMAACLSRLGQPLQNSKTSCKHHTVSSKCTRFGNPAQVRSQELEAQYAATTAELQELSGKHKALEARNLLLEKLVQLNKQHQQPEPSAVSRDDVRIGDTLEICLFIVTLSQAISCLFCCCRPASALHCHPVSSHCHLFR